MQNQVPVSQNRPVTGRFAPSPSGRLHLGNLACSLLAWLSAKSQGGRIVLRIEDLDAERCPRVYADLLEQDLAWLGLTWDEGGSTGGAHAPYYQSECGDIYTESYRKLEQRGAGVPLLLLPLPAARRQRTPHLGRQRHLSGHLPGTDAGRDRGKAQKESPCLPPDGAGRGNHLYGRLHGHPHGEPAPGLRRFLSAPGRRGVCLSVGGGGGRCPHGRHRGGARGRSAFLHGAAAVPVPAAGLAAARFAHCPLLLAADGRRLSKRDGDQSLENLRAKYTAPEIIGKLAFAYGLQPEPAPRTPESLVPDFAWTKVPKQDICLPEGLF